MTLLPDHTKQANEALRAAAQRTYDIAKEVNKVRNTPLPEPEELRKIAMAIYTPPFKYQRGYVFDSQSNMVADNDEVNDAVASRVRGWGKLGYLQHGAAIQDEIGRMMADALNALYQKEAYGAAEYRRALNDAVTECVCMKTASGTDDVERGFNAALRRAVVAIRKLGEDK